MTLPITQFARVAPFVLLVPLPSNMTAQTSSLLAVSHLTAMAIVGQVVEVEVEVAVFLTNVSKQILAALLA